MKTIIQILRGLLPLQENTPSDSYEQKCAKQGPSRPLNNSLGNVITKFPSRKVGHTLSVESLIELFILMQLEILFFVKRFHAQGSIVMVRRPNKRGYEYERPYTPDIVGLTVNLAEFAIGAKPSSVIEEDLKSEHPRFKKTKDGRYEDPAAKAALEKQNVHHLVVTEKDFGAEFFANACLLTRYVHAECPSRKLADEIKTCMRAMGISTLEQLALEIESNRRDATEEDIEELNRELMLECINWMLVNGEVYADLDSYSLQDVTRFELYNTPSLARCRLQDKSADQLPVVDAKQFSLSADSIITFANRTYTTVSTQKNKAFLRDENGKTELFDIEDLERHFQSGALTCSDQSEGPSLTPFAAASTARQEEAIRRAEAVSLYENGFKTIPMRTFYDWKRRMNQARIQYGCGLSGLVGEIRPGNRKAKTCSEAKEYMLGYLMVSYLGNKPQEDQKWSFPISPSRENDNKIQAWAHYKLCAKAQGLHPLSFASFTRAINRISRELKELKKAGPKSAYQVEDPRAGEWSGATHGQFAGHIVEIDHTLIDVEVIDEDDFGLGRLWLTIAIDTYSRMIVGYYLSFSAPSKRSVMMVIRDMVYRNGYLPMCISLDGGKEFHSIYIDQLLARFRIQKRCRPPHKARYGAIVERLFRTLNQDFWHNLLGNTRLMVNPRKVSRDFIAKKRAIWGVEPIIDAFERYVKKYNTKLVHGTTGVIPKVKHDASYSNLLPYQKRQIKYDQSFLICTMLEPGNKQELTCLRGGLNALGGRYSHAVLRKEINRGQKFYVKYDPMDLRVLYFAHKGKWKTAKLVGGNYQHALSEVEIQILSDIEQAKHKGKYKRNLARLFTKAQFVAEIKEEEELIKMRRAEVDRHISDIRDASVNPEGMPAHETEEPEPALIDLDTLPDEPIQTGLFAH